METTPAQLCEAVALRRQQNKLNLAISKNPWGLEVTCGARKGAFFFPLQNCRLLVGFRVLLGRAWHGLFALSWWEIAPGWEQHPGLSPAC